jgi:hypothetical protein
LDETLNFEAADPVPHLSVPAQPHFHGVFLKGVFRQVGRKIIAYGLFAVIKRFQIGRNPLAGWRFRKFDAGLLGLTGYN